MRRYAKERKFTGESERSADRIGMSDRSLRGQTVVVTRPRPQAERFSAELRELGARPIEFPVIEIREAKDPEPLRASVAALSDFDWIVFTSVNGVKHVHALLSSRTDSVELPSELRVAVIGPATASEVSTRFGVEPRVMPDSYRAEALVEALRERIPDLSGLRMLLPRAAEARDVLPDRLRDCGARVREVAAYRTVPPDVDGAPLARKIRAGEIDWVTFTASSTVRNFVRLVGESVRPARVAAIGPITAETAREHGLPVDVTAEEYTVAGLIRGLVRAAARGGTPSDEGTRGRPAAGTPRDVRG